MVINELSKEMKVTNKDVIAYLRSQGFKVSSHLQTADEDMIKAVREHFANSEEEDDEVPEKVEGKEPKLEEKKEDRKPVQKPMRKIALDEYITCRSVTPWKLVNVSVDGNVVYTWEYFGAEEEVMYRDLQAWRKKEIITAPQIIIEDDDIREAWKQDMTDTYQTLIGVEYPEELFDMEDSKFEDFVRKASRTVQEVIKTTAISMIHNENYPSLQKILIIDEVFRTDLKDFLVK